MATYITIGYGDRASYERTEPSVREVWPLQNAPSPS
jgi:hypothetical protein